METGGRGGNGREGGGRASKSQETQQQQTERLIRQASACFCWRNRSSSSCLLKAWSSNGEVPPPELNSHGKTGLGFLLLPQQLFLFRSLQCLVKQWWETRTTRL